MLDSNFTWILQLDNEKTKSRKSLLGYSSRKNTQKLSEMTKHARICISTGGMYYKKQNLTYNQSSNNL